MKENANAQPEKTALVLSGGGMQCAYGAGVLTALAERYAALPELIIAASGSVGGALYFATGQYQHGLSLFLSLAKEPRFIDYFARPKIDIDCLIDRFMRREHPLELAALAASKSDIVVPLTRAGDGATVFLEVPKTDEAYEYARAAKAVPFVYGKTVSLGGVEYLDGEFGADMDDYLVEAVRRGATRIVAVYNQRGVTRLYRASVKALALLGSIQEGIGLARAAARELAPRRAFIPPESVRIVSLRRPATPALSLLTSSPFAVRAAFNRGYDDAIANEHLAALLCGS